ncbi:MAG: ATP-binding protein [Janthinobacterium lividum]
MKYQQSPPLLEFWLPADPGAVPQARHKAIHACTEAGLSEEDCFTLDLALGEALANAVVHGTDSSKVKPNSTSQIYLGMWGFQKNLIIQVKDCGMGFKPPPPPYAMPDAAQEATHGRGLPLMEILTDAMAVCQGCTQDGGSSVFLIKRMPH